MVGKDKPFNHGGARRAFINIRNYLIKSDDDSSLMYLVRIEAIITSAVDSVGLFLYILDTYLTPCVSDGQGALSSKQINQKEGGNSQEALDRLRNLFPVAAENVLQYCYHCIIDGLVDEGEPVDTELSAQRTGTGEERLNNLGKCYMTAF